ncbi:MAG: T9SS C-terminal target domain-containing protein [Bacteroidetes bacterium]|nr:MAG: T9SS C-terminal target domain-containing protein [Bacteroidota bacterium]
MKTRIFLFCLSLIFAATGASAQQFERFSAEVIQNGQTLPYPFTGGINTPQLSAPDLNADGVPDLYIFDRVGNVHLTFINMGTPDQTDYVFAPEYARRLPVCVNWVAMRDYNHDGAADLFTHAGNEGVSGVRVFKGHFEGDTLAFERIEFAQNFPFNVLTFPTSSGNLTQIYVSNIDYPDLNDIDQDGDLDILSFNSVGGHVLFYQNLSQEKGFGADTLIFDLEDDCWGRFFEADMSEAITLGNDPDHCPPNFSGGNASDRHQGSTLLTFDEDGDGDREVIIGDVANEYLFRLVNGGTPQAAFMVEQDNAYPAYDEPVFIPFFPAAFYIDLNNDGRRDFVAAPNDRSATPDYDNVWFYKNMTSDDAPVFELQTTRLFTQNMLDFGSNAYPAFADVNADGLTDLVVGSFTVFQLDGSFEPFLFLYENTGTPTNPRFELTDNNWLNFNNLSNDIVSGSWRFAPTFGDLDNDGDLDLLVGERDGRLIFSENIAGAGVPMNFAPPQVGWMGIDVGQNAAPQIKDLNRDGLPDLVVGEFRGRMTFFPNIGTPNAPLFHANPLESPNVSQWGGIKKVTAAQVGNLTPFLLDYGDDFKLIFGWENGRIHLYEDIQNNLDGNFLLLNDNFGKLWEGVQTAPALADLNGDGRLEMAIGNRRGGLAFYQTDLPAETIVATTDKKATPTLDLFPNPAFGQISIVTRNITVNQTTLHIANMTGQTVLRTALSETETTLDISALPSGVYFIQIESKNGRTSRRFVHFSEQ